MENRFVRMAQTILLVSALATTGCGSSKSNQHADGALSGDGGIAAADTSSSGDVGSADAGPQTDALSASGVTADAPASTVAADANSQADAPATSGRNVDAGSPTDTNVVNNRNVDAGSPADTRSTGVPGDAGTNPDASAARPVQLVSGLYFTCARFDDGTGKCWGDNEFGALGAGALKSGATKPLKIAAISNASEIAAGAYFICARQSGTVRCWGEGSYGQLGGARVASSTVPVILGDSLFAKATQLSAGRAFACALISSPAMIRCWGYNLAGELGLGANAPAEGPQTVTGITEAAEIRSGEDHTCARLPDGGVKCWGNGKFGMLGNGKSGIDVISSTPVPVVGLTGVRGLAAGRYHTCALMTGGTLSCWGSNDFGQLGNRTTTDSSTPVGVDGLKDVAEVKAGGSTTCARLTNGGVSCWGNNDFGELGNGSADKSSLRPVSVTGITDAVEITVGYEHACARLSTGAVLCWGANGDGQLGNGTQTYSNVPVSVVELF